MSYPVIFQLTFDDYLERSTVELCQKFFIHFDEDIVIDVTDIRFLSSAQFCSPQMQQLTL